MSSLELPEIEPEEVVDEGVGPGCEPEPGEGRHVCIVMVLAVAVGMATAGHSAQVAIALGANMIEFVKHGYHFLIKRLVLKSWQAKGDLVELFGAIHLVPLDRVANAAPPDIWAAILETEGGDPGLQTVAVGGTGLTNGEKQLASVDMVQLVAASANGGYQLFHGQAEAKRLFGFAGGEPWRHIFGLQGGRAFACFDLAPH